MNYVRRHASFQVSVEQKRHLFNRNLAMVLDEVIYRGVQSIYGRSIIVDFVMLLFELNLLRYILVGLLFSIWLTRNPALQKGAVVAMLAVVASVGLRPLFKSMAYRPRPWITEGCPGLAPCYPDSSFPSGHMFLACAMTVALWRADRRAGMFMAFISLMIGISRIYLGEHWFSDLVAGGAMGAVVGLLLSLAADKKPLSGLVGWSLRVADKLKLPGRSVPAEA